MPPMPPFQQGKGCPKDSFLLPRIDRALSKWSYTPPFTLGNITRYAMFRPRESVEEEGESPVAEVRDEDRESTWGDVLR